MSSPPPARQGDSTFSTLPLGLPEGQTEGRTDTEAPSPAWGRTDTQWKAGRDAWRRGGQLLSRLLLPDTAGKQRRVSGDTAEPCPLQTAAKGAKPSVDWRWFLNPLPAWRGRGDNLCTVLP